MPPETCRPSRDQRRFTGFAAQKDYCVAKGIEVYGNEYAIHFPRRSWPAGRNRKLSPIHDRIAALGAGFDAYNGWERATWFAKPGDDTSEAATLTFDRDGPWQPRIREECLAVRDAAGILDLPGFSRFRLQGPSARDWLARQITGIVPKAGRIGLGYFADDKGRIVNEMSIMALAEDFFFLLDDPGPCDAPSMSTLWHEGRIVGETLSGGWGHRVDRSIALGMLRADLAESGRKVEVEIFGQRFAATVAPDGPLWDAENRRLRT